MKFAAILALAGTMNMAQAYVEPVTPVLNKCTGPLKIFVSDNNKQLVQSIQDKGHQTIKSEDQKFSASKLKAGDFVLALNYSQYSLLFGQGSQEMNLPATLEGFNAQFEKLEKTMNKSTELPVLKAGKLETAFERLHELEIKRQENKLTHQEANTTVGSLFKDIFVGDGQLAGMTVKIAVVYEPRMAIKYFEDSFALEEGYAQNGKNNSLVVGIEMTGLEFKNRVMKNVEEIMQKKISQLDDTHVMSESGIFATIFENSLNGNVLVDADEAQLAKQMVEMLPTCAK